MVANWKMNPASYKEAKELLEVTKKSVERSQGISVIIAPPSLYLRELRASYKGKKISFGAQNAHAEAGGAHTGEISMKQIKDAHASYVIVGHAERRAGGETNDDTKKKIASAFAEGIQPIFCIGETSRSGTGEHYEFVREQIRIGLSEIPPGKIAKIIIAYEPVWAIGATSAMNPRDMHEMAIFIRKTLVELHGSVTAGGRNRGCRSGHARLPQCR